MKLGKEVSIFLQFLTRTQVSDLIPEIKKLIAILWSSKDSNGSSHFISFDEPVIDIPSSKISCSIFNLLSPSEIAFSLSDSLTLNSDAFLITVWPFAKHAAILSMGISSIILGMIFGVYKDI